MVTDAVLDWFFDLVDWLISGMPDLELPKNIMDLSWIRDINYFLPISEMYALFAAFFLLGGPMAATSLIIWFLVGVLRGGSPKS